MLVYLIELLLLDWHLLLYVLRREDRLEVHPSPLGLYPVLQSVLDQHDLGLDVVRTRDDRLYVGGTFHHQQGVEVVVQNLRRVVDRLEDVGHSLGVGLRLYLQFLKVLDDAVELLLQAPLLLSLLRDLLYLLPVLVQAFLQDELQSQLIVRLDLLDPTGI